MKVITNFRLFLVFFLFFYCFYFNANSEEDLNKKISNANIYIEFGEIDKALEILNSTDSNDKENFKLLLSYGRAFLKLREYEKAKQYFEDAIFTSELEDEEAYLGISKAYLEIGDFKNSYKNIRPLLKKSYKPVQTELILVEIELKTGYSEKAKKRLLKLLQKRKNDPDVLIGYSKYLFLNEDPFDAIDVLEKEIVKNKNIPKIYVYLGTIKGIMGNNNEKKRLYLKAAEIYKKLGYTLRAKILTDASDKFKVADKNINTAPISKPKPNESNEDINFKNKELEKKNTPTIEDGLEKHIEKDPVEILKINLSNQLSIMNFDTSWIAQASNNQNFVPFKTSEVFFGSGFLINNGNYIITNYHVIKDTSIVLIKTGKGKESVAKVAYYDEKKDLAILELLNKVGNKNESFLINNFEDPKTGSDALVIGYPMPDFFGSSLPTITEGIVAKTTGLNDNPFNFLITSKINSGNSGGPIVNKKGCLIGIAVGKLDTKKFFEKLDMLPEDMNIGIKSSNASVILGSNKNNKCTLKKEFNRVDLYESILPKVVLIIAGN